MTSNLASKFFSGESKALSLELKEVNKHNNKSKESINAPAKDDIMLFVRLVNKANEQKKQASKQRKSRLRKSYK